MTYFGAAAVVALSTALAVFAAWLVGRLTPLESRRRHHEVGSVVFQQVGVMISVLLAFVFSEVWGEYRTAALAINGECAALHGAAILANAVPDGQGLPVVRAIAVYGQTVIKTEWPTMAQRHRGPGRGARPGRHDARGGAHESSAVPWIWRPRTRFFRCWPGWRDRETQTFRSPRACRGSCG